jgi:anti-sigma B factor antagonist
MGIASVEHFEVSICLGVDRARLELRGELDAASAPVLVQRFEETCGDDESCRSLILVDATALTYCDSSGIHALLRLAANCDKNGTRFRLLGAHGPVRRVLEITNTVAALNADPVES